MKTLRSALAVLAAIPAMTTAAEAHHVMGGVLPGTFAEGLLSGLGHPIIGLDHFAFLIAVGLVAALYGRRAYVLPAWFLAGMAGGLAVHLAAIDVPAAETLVALSVVVLGALAIRARAIPAAVAAALFALAGLFHGYAFAESIVGAEATPLLAYLAGLIAIQYAIAAGVVGLLRADVTAALRGEPARIAGGAVLGVGLVFLANNLVA